MATRIAVMKDGVLQQFGTPEDIYDRPANVFVATFMGSPPMNLLPARISEGSNRLAIEGTAITLPVPQSATTSPAPGQKVLIGLRPEWLTLVTDNAPDQPVFELDVEVVEPTGPDIFVALRLGEHEIMARLPTGSPVRIKQRTRFALDLSKAILFDASLWAPERQRKKRRRCAGDECLGVGIADSHC